MGESFGVAEDVDKRQVCHANSAENATVEHLGLMVNHANPNQDITPKSSWTKAEAVLDQ